MESGRKMARLDFANERKVKYMTTQRENWIESKLDAYGSELREKGMEEIERQISEEKLSSDDEADAIAELEQEIEKKLEDYRAELLKEVEA
jgi:transposase